MNRQIIIALVPLIIIWSVPRTDAQTFSLDSTFNYPDGYYYTSVGGLMQDFGKSIAITSSGDYYLGGFSYALNYLQDGMIIKVTANGSLDPSFNNNGKKIINLTPNREVITDIALDQNGKIVAVWLASDTTNLSYSRPALMRFLPNGSYDNTFGNGGIVYIPTMLTPYTEDYYGLGIDGANRIVLAAGDHDANVYDPDIKVMRFNPDGTPDSSFGLNGVVVVTMPNIQTVVGLVAHEDGKVLVYADSYSPQTLTDIVLVKLFPDGSRDTTFGTNGVSLHAFTANNDRVTDLRIQPDEKIVISGLTIPNLVGGDADILSARFHPNGTLDTSFASNGVFTWSSLPNSGSESGKCMVLRNDGKILINGYIVMASQACDLIFVRLNPDGQLDASFGTGGILIDHISLQTIGNDMLLQSDGKVVIGGSMCFNLSAVYPVIFRYRNDLTTGPELLSDAEKEINIYPTVFQDYITVDLNLLFNEPVVVEIYNQLGMLTGSYELNNSKTLDLAYLPRATYFIVIRNEMGVLHKQLIIRQ